MKLNSIYPIASLTTSLATSLTTSLTTSLRTSLTINLADHQSLAVSPPYS